MRKQLYSLILALVLAPAYYMSILPHFFSIRSADFMFDSDDLSPQPPKKKLQTHTGYDTMITIQHLFSKSVLLTLFFYLRSSSHLTS